MRNPHYLARLPTLCLAFLSFCTLHALELEDSSRIEASLACWVWLVRNNSVKNFYFETCISVKLSGCKAYVYANVFWLCLDLLKLRYFFCCIYLYKHMYILNFWKSVLCILTWTCKTLHDPNYFGKLLISKSTTIIATKTQTSKTYILALILTSHNQQADEAFVLEKNLQLQSM